MLGLDLAGTLNRIGDVIGQQGIAAQFTFVIRETTVGRLTPVIVVNLENTIIIGAIRVGRTNNISAVGGFMLSNACPLRQFGFRNTQGIHFLSQRAACEGFAPGGGGQSQGGNQDNEKFHFSSSEKQFKTNYDFFEQFQLSFIEKCLID